MIQLLSQIKQLCQRFRRQGIRGGTRVSILLIATSLFVTSTGVNANETPSESSFEIDAILDITQRIIGGRPATTAEWPSVVALVSPGNFSAVDRQFCGGTVVASRWVMTAAHCIYNSFNSVISNTSVRVVEGVTNLRFEPIPQEHIVVNIIPHPLYDHSVPASYNDIALLELATELDAPPANLFVGDSESLVGQNGWIVGWGAISFESEATAVYPDDLRSASVPFVSRDICNSPESYNGYVVGFLTCAGFTAGGVDTCVGDSGGPLFGEVDGEMQQIGITSFGQGCAQPQFFGIYTHIPSYIPWLANYIWVPDQPNPPTGVNIPRANNQVVADTMSGGGASLAGMWLFSFVLLRCLFLSGCVGSNAGTPVQKKDTEVKSMTQMKEDDMRPGVRMGEHDVRIGHARDRVMESLQDGSLTQIDCQAQRVAMVGSKRAFLLERCSRVLSETQWPEATGVSADNSLLSPAAMSVTSVAVYFIDQQLVRMDLSISDDVLDTTTMLDKHFERQGNVWTHGKDQVHHRNGSVQLIDAELATRIPKLFE